MEKEIDFIEADKQMHCSEYAPDKAIENNISPSCHNMICKTVDQLKLTDHSFVLEIGFENTEHIPFLFQEVKGISYYGNNISEVMVQQASSDQALKIREGQVQFIQAKEDGALDFEDCYFDYCFTINTIYFWKDPISHFKEIYRVLQPGGKFNLAFVEKKFGGDLPWTHGDFIFYDVNEVKTLFRKAGFVNIEVKQMTEEIIDKTRKELIRPFLSITGRK
ncbi:class I SAM-dependent methyltransferase [Pedobacter cryoconitis]|uniref:SAM-dependent methyltransferase n=1 Tax=Pedobacter cryoconitis TaxID=188932 RepID=A0A7X0J0B7_9SPHI|nr:class I SAM-dependent methyltransferase [Pedobacter cryoconitis]MBB6498570.1 SAM-dependent methyltransferase [Pedobacter cryoconitis]